MRTSPVTVTGGTIVGVHAEGLKTYLGIPFAAPPVGDLRWRAPQPVVPWDGIKEATSFSPACAQTAVWLNETKSEDGLYLNVWAPEDAENLPVIVWIHGGGYYGGSGKYSCDNLARRGAVIVSMNYRLGVLGFFSHPELTAESPHHASGNQALQDQIAALHWVQHNITTFGGDPGSVTIMGQSSGGESVAILIASPLAKGLFHRAISQSGNDFLPINTDDYIRFDQQAAAEATGLSYAESLGANSLADLRKMSVESLHAAFFSPRTVVDGYVLHDDLTTTYRNHHQNDVPLLAGWNAEEGKDLTQEINGIDDLTPSQVQELVKRLLGREPSAALLAAYPGIIAATPERAVIDQLMNDWWGWRIAYWAGLQAKYGRSKSYLYFFAHQPAEPLVPCSYGGGAGHGAEVPYVFYNLKSDPRPWTAKDHQLATQLADTWLHFARTGTPNGPALAAWPAYDGSHPTVLRIGNEAELKAHPLPDFTLFATQRE
ncbi:Fumonisin B1 esterase (plasmid) [Brevundimonas subvibrioides]|uniref:carboxylesterase/lipase family protein n=1 Tax=Brevundimonas subvibrioides TaxID=74313 RepID=UPI0032D5AA74